MSFPELNNLSYYSNLRYLANVADNCLDMHQINHDFSLDDCDIASLSYSENINVASLESEYDKMEEKDDVDYLIELENSIRESPLFTLPLLPATPPNSPVLNYNITDSDELVDLFIKTESNDYQVNPDFDMRIFNRFDLRTTKMIIENDISIYNKERRRNVYVECNTTLDEFDESNKLDYDHLFKFGLKDYIEHKVISGPSEIETSGITSNPANAVPYKPLYIDRVDFEVEEAEEINDMDDEELGGLIEEQDAGSMIMVEEAEFVGRESVNFYNQLITVTETEVGSVGSNFSTDSEVDLPLHNLTLSDDEDEEEYCSDVGSVESVDLWWFADLEGHNWHDDADLTRSTRAVVRKLDEYKATRERVSELLTRVTAGYTNRFIKNFRQLDVSISPSYSKFKSSARFMQPAGGWLKGPRIVEFGSIDYKTKAISVDLKFAHEYILKTWFQLDEAPSTAQVTACGEIVDFSSNDLRVNGLGITSENSTGFRNSELFYQLELWRKFDCFYNIEEEEMSSVITCNNCLLEFSKRFIAFKLNAIFLKQVPRCRMSGITILGAVNIRNGELQLFPVSNKQKLSDQFMHGDIGNAPPVDLRFDKFLH